MTLTIPSATPQRTVSARLPQLSRDQQDARSRFGRALHQWMKANNLSLQNPHDWSQANGKAGPHNSQLSLCVRGVFDPKAGFFYALARFNQALESSDFQEITDLVTRQRLLNAEPFLTIEGKVATAMDFFGMFVGEISCGIDEEPEEDNPLSMKLTAEEEALILSIRRRQNA